MLEATRSRICFIIVLQMSSGEESFEECLLGLGLGFFNGQLRWVGQREMKIKTHSVLVKCEEEQI